MFVLDDFADVLELIGIAAAIGGIAGFVTSLTRPPAGRSTAVFGIDNRLRFPRLYKNKARTRTWGIDLGSLGPALVGAGGAVFAVFATGVDKSEITANGATEILDAIDYVQLIVLGVAGGAAGELVFRTLAAGGKVSLASAESAVQDAAAAAASAAQAGQPPEQVRSKALTAGEIRLEDPSSREARLDE